MKTLIELVALDMAGTNVDEPGIVYRTLEDSLRAAGAGMAPMDVQTRPWRRGSSTASAPFWRNAMRPTGRLPCRG
ncbi:hypothetical protein [Paeniglutamicibacter sp.]|uniref:hypothetical protein n=1 Tax=Paeniglutamicibacter sp. TaxID=1934391 RepID=UPI003988A952